MTNGDIPIFLALGVPPIPCVNMDWPVGEIVNILERPEIHHGNDMASSVMTRAKQSLLAENYHEVS